MVAALRNANVRAELYLGNPKNMGNQLKYADQRNAPCVIIQGSNEKKPGKRLKPRIIVKDLILGREIASASTEREDYIAKQNEAQIVARETQLVATVQKILKKYGVRWN
jgi:histidyl-tRNA synthetase